MFFRALLQDHLRMWQMEEKKSDKIYKHICRENSTVFVLIPECNLFPSAMENWPRWLTGPAAGRLSSLRFWASIRWLSCCNRWHEWLKRGGYALHSSGPPLKCQRQACTDPWWEKEEKEIAIVGHMFWRLQMLSCFNHFTKCKMFKFKWTLKGNFTLWYNLDLTI